MRTPASIARYPIHPMLLAIPLGLWVFSLACDIVEASGGAGEAWSTAALFAIVGGLAGALIATVPGFVNFELLEDCLRRVALRHISIVLFVAALFLANALLRMASAAGAATPWLSAAGIALLLAENGSLIPASAEGQTSPLPRTMG